MELVELIIRLRRACRDYNDGTNTIEEVREVCNLINKNGYSYRIIPTREWYIEGFDVGSYCERFTSNHRQLD